MRRINETNESRMSRGSKETDYSEEERAGEIEAGVQEKQK